jgi:post-segregation antitoxin (ccd killing protein)
MFASIVWSSASQFSCPVLSSDHAREKWITVSMVLDASIRAVSRSSAECAWSESNGGTAVTEEVTVVVVVEEEEEEEGRGSGVNGRLLFMFIQLGIPR